MINQYFFVPHFRPFEDGNWKKICRIVASAVWYAGQSIMAKKGPDSLDGLLQLRPLEKREESEYKESLLSMIVNYGPQLGIEGLTKLFLDRGEISLDFRERIDFNSWAYSSISTLCLRKDDSGIISTKISDPVIAYIVSSIFNALAENDFGGFDKKEQFPIEDFLDSCSPKLDGRSRAFLAQGSTNYF